MTDSAPHDSAHAAATNDHDRGAHPPGGLAKYIYVFIALCVLTSMSFFTYSEAWPFSKDVARAFMLAVSCTKALLVILFFMHVKYEANWKYVLTIPAGMMSIFLMLMLVPDVGMRMRHASEERKQYAAQPAAATGPQPFLPKTESPTPQP